MEREAKERLSKYAQESLRVARLMLIGTDVEKGEFREHLHKYVRSLGWSVHHGVVDMRQLIETFVDACGGSGLSKQEVRETITAAITEAAGDPLPFQPDDKPKGNVIRFPAKT